MCDETHGIEPSLYTIVRRINWYLYDALNSVGEYIELGVPDMYLTLPSGVSWKIIESFVLNVGMKLPVKEFNRIGVTIMGIFKFAVYLPKIHWKDMVQQAYAIVNSGINGSENWTYYDEATGTHKVGTDFSPVRQYHLITDGWADFGPIILFSLIVYLLVKFGLIKTMIDFIKRAYGWYKNTVFKRGIQEMGDLIDNIYLAVTDPANPPEVQRGLIKNEIDQNELKLNTISSQLGVRLILSN